MIEVRHRALSAEAFAAFGSVFEAPQAPARTTPVARLENGRATAQPMLTLSCLKPDSLPVVIEQLERHPQSSQTFLSLDSDAFLVVVAPSRGDGSPDGADVQAFVGRGGQGFSYHPGVWHHGLVALGRLGRFAALIWRDGGPDDVIETTLGEPVRVT
jgi:ureidoglycolate lyase